MRYARALSKAQVEYAGEVAESIRLAQEMNVFGVGEAQRTQIRPYIRRSQGYYYRTQLLAKLVGNTYQSFIYLLVVAFVAGLYYLAGRGRAAALGGIVLLLVRAGITGQMVQGAYQGVATSIPFIERTQEAEKRYADSAIRDGDQALESVRTVAFEQVGFSYTPGQPVLSDIDFEVSGGEVIGIIGPSGAGKSTLVQLLLRLRVPDHGRYLINGITRERHPRGRLEPARLLCGPGTAAAARDRHREHPLLPRHRPGRGGKGRQARPHPRRRRSAGRRATTP